MSKQQRADLLLVLVTGFWGMSYFLTDLCMTQMPPLGLNAFRFLVGFEVLVLCCLPRMRGVSRATLKYSVLVGLSLAAAYIFYAYGLLYTSISNAGFICALPVITTPILEFLITRKRPGRQLLAALALCAVGMGLLTLNDQFRPALGDILCFGVAVFYGVDLVITDRAVRRPEVDPLQMGVLQLGVVGVVMLILSLLLEKPSLPTTPAVWGSALFLAVFCSGVGFMVQTVQQQYTTAAHVGLIFTLEPLFSAVVAYFLAGERLEPRGYVGAGLMMVSLVLMELDLGAVLEKLKRKAGRDR